MDRHGIFCTIMMGIKTHMESKVVKTYKKSTVLLEEGIFM